MGSTVNRAWPLPDASSTPDVPYWMGQLGNAIDAEYGAAWTAFVPVVYTTMGTTPTPISATVNRARYVQYGRTVHAQADVTLNASTTGGVGISLPVTSRDRILTAGVCALYGTSLPADQSGAAYMAADKAKLVVVATSNGFRDGTSGQTIRYSVTYEVA